MEQHITTKSMPFVIIVNKKMPVHSNTCTTNKESQKQDGKLIHFWRKQDDLSGFHDPTNSNIQW